LLPENERAETLKNLHKTKNDLNTLLEKLPVSNRSPHVKNQKLQLEKSIEEIEQSLRIFSKKKVFIKDDF